MDENFFKLVRQSCSPATWSQGVELARAGAVIGENITESEIVLRVASPNRMVSATVKLWPEEEDWHCDCRPLPTACEHIAATVIALRRAAEKGEALPISSVDRAIVHYCFSRKNGSLAFERQLVGAKGETPLQGRLTALLSGRVAGPPVNASRLDVTLDSYLGDKSHGVLPQSIVVGTLVQLRGSENVRLDGAKIEVGVPAAQVQAVFADTEEGIRVFLERSPEVEEVFSNGALIVGGQLRPKAVPDLTSREKEMLLGKKVFPAEAFAELSSRVLPELEKKLKVDLRTNRLSGALSQDKPYLVIETSAVGEVLSLLPLVVYGDPPYARLDAGKLNLVGSSVKIPQRDLRAEARLIAVLHSTLGLSAGRRADYRADAASKMTERLLNTDFRTTGNGVSAFLSRPPLSAQVSFREGALHVDFRLPGGEGSADARRVFQAWREGLERVPLLEGGWAPLPKEWLDRYAHRILDLFEGKEHQETLPNHLKPEVAHLCQELDIPCPTDFSLLKKSLEDFAGIKSAPLPPDLNAELRAYQREGVNWLSFLKENKLGALLADDMGLGKTLQTLCVLQKPALVVAPTSVLSNWEKEAGRFRPGLKVSVYHGAARSLDKSADVTLTTYALLRRDCETLFQHHWATVVLDEAQNIKNPESQVAQAAYGLKADFKIALTGTPVENRLEDLWSLFHFLNPGLLGTRSGFNERYGSVTADPKAAQVLRTKTRPFVLRRLKQEVARELPPRTEGTLYCELEPEERITYEAVHAAARRDVLAQLQKGSSMLAALECLLRLRQAACHTGLLPNGTAKESSKTRLLMEKLEEVISEGHKALVFSQWTSLLDLFEPQLKQSGLAFCRIDGQTPAPKRSEIVEAFQSPDGPPVLMMTLKSGGVGLNLTAADHVFLVDPWWNPAAEDQAADRAHRIGQLRPVFVHRLVAKDTVEEKILLLQEKKRAIAAAALGGDSASGALTREDLLALLA